VVLQSDQWERLSPVFTEEEWDHVVITGAATDTLRVVCDFGGGHGARSLGLVVSEKNIMDALYVERIHATHLLATDVQAKFGDRRVIGGVESGVVDTNFCDIWVFDPYITQKVTLRANWDNDFIASVESADVIHALWFDCKVRVTLVVLAPETDLGFTSDVRILSSD